MLSIAAFTGVARPVTNHVYRQTVECPAPDVRHIVFLARGDGRIGGGGGGNQQPGPVRRAQGVGTDAITVRATKPSPTTAPVTTRPSPPMEVTSALPSIAIEAKPLALGTVEQIGLPAGELFAASTGRGSGGGAGTGHGTGLGSGRGPGVGPGSGGGIGGGVHRPGGAVTAPRLIAEVKPKYTSDALVRKIQGSVMLEAVVTSDGCTSRIRVIGPLDHGLDQQAVAAVAQWRFEPGRLAGQPVDVLVTIILDFTIR